MLQPYQSLHVSIALSRLRRGVTLCCWVIGLALLAQVLIWGVATFLDVRYEVLPDAEKPALIVSADDAKPETVGSTGGLVARTGDFEQPQMAAEAEPAIDPNRVPTKHDQMMSSAIGITFAAGRLSIVVLFPLVLLGVLLSAGSATPGVEKVVSSFMWLIVVTLLSFPIGGLIGVPWNDGALLTYESITRHVDAALASSAIEGGSNSLTFYAKMLVLPLACVVGIAIVGVRFSMGVESGVVPKEDMRLDPTLEKEAGNIKVSSLHGGRGAGALKAANVAAATPGTPAVAAAAAQPVGAATAPGPITQLSPGTMPKRLI